MYADEYFEDGGAWVCGFWTGSYQNNEKKLRHEARSALKMLPTTGRRLLEIGAAGGFFLDEARASGYAVTGIELNRTMAEWGEIISVSTSSRELSSRWNSRSARSTWSSLRMCSSTCATLVTSLRA